MGKYEISVQQIPVYSKGAEKPTHKENSTPELTSCSNDRRSHQWYSLGRSVFHEWKWEIGALLISILTLMAIIITLSSQNGKVAPNLPSGINLNSLIAILTTILRIAILVVISEVIAQLKWYWLNQPRSLGHPIAFCEASQGFLGSFMLLFRSKTPPLALFGCLVTLLSVGLGPFVQQSIKTVVCNRPAPELNASIPSSTVTPSSYQELNLSSDSSYKMQAALIDGFLYPEKASSGIPFICPTGNCTFPAHNGISHTSLGVCSLCFNTTSLLREIPIAPFVNQGGIASSGYNFSLPNGMNITLWNDSITYSEINMQIETGILNWADPLLTPELRSVLDVSISNISMLAFTWEPCDFGRSNCPHEGLNLTHLPTSWDIMAASCTLYGCLRSYFAEVNLGSISETLVSTTPMTPLGEEISTIPTTTLPVTVIGTDTLTLVTDIPTVTPFPQTPKRSSMKTSLGTETWIALKIPCFLNGVAYDLKNLSMIPSSENRTLIPVIFNTSNTSNTKNIVDLPQDCLYRVPDGSFASMQDFIEQTLNGYCGAQQSVECGSLWWLQRLSNNVASFSAFNDSMGAVSAAATDQLWLIGRDGGGFNPGVVNGTVYQTLVCTRFDGFWLASPALSIVASSILLCIVMVRTAIQKKDVPSWKSSVLPLVFHGPLLRDGRESTRLMTLDEMEKEANGIAIRLKTEGERCGLMNPEIERERVDQNVDSGSGEMHPQICKLTKCLTL